MNMEFINLVIQKILLNIQLLHFSHFLGRKKKKLTILMYKISYFFVYLVIADFGVCPFTMDADRAGIPVGVLR